jgi:hypothetical protein
VGAPDRPAPAQPTPGELAAQVAAGPPPISDRLRPLIEFEVAAELLGHAHDLAALPTGVVLIGEKGFAGRQFERQMNALRITFVRPDRRNETRRHGNLAAIRQRIESIINTTKSQLSLERHGGRTPAGVMTRVAQRVLVLAAAIRHNWATNAPVKRSLIAYDH